MTRLFLILVLAFCSVFELSGQTASQVKESQEVFREAQTHLKNNELEVFEKKVAKAAKLRPNHPTLMLNHAYALTKVGKFDLAVQKLNEIARMGTYVNISDIKEFDKLAGKEGYGKVLGFFGENLAPVGKATIELEVPDPDLLIEGVVFDRKNRSFLLTSVHHQKLLRYTADNERESETQLELSPLGIRMDSANNYLWVSLAGVKQGQNISESQIGKSGIAKIDLESLEIVEEYIFKGDSTGQTFGDLLPTSDERIYLSDSKGGLIYKFDTGDSQFKAVTAKGDLISPQGMAFSSGGPGLIVADYSMGLVKVNPGTGAVATIENKTNTTLLGIDGLYRYKNSLLAIQNGVSPYRILKLKLNPDESMVTKAEVLLANDPVLDDPTLGMVVDSTFFFNANSQWYRFSSEYNSEEQGKRANPKILSIDLD